MNGRDQGQNSIEIDLQDHEQCRKEIDNRTGISEKLIFGQTTIFGLGISLLGALAQLSEQTSDGETLSKGLPYIFLGISIFCSFLAHFWLAHSLQIYKLGAYIGKELRERLKEQSGYDVLRWEVFSKIFDQGGQRATRMLFGEGSTYVVPVTRNIINIQRLLMLSVPLLFIVIAVFAAVKIAGVAAGKSLNWNFAIEILVSVVAFVLWWLAYRESRLVERKRKICWDAVMNNYSEENGSKDPIKSGLSKA